MRTRLSFLAVLLAAGPLAAAPKLPDEPPDFAALKDKLLKTGGGSMESEAAVARGLAWLARQQHKDGYWEFDGSSKDMVAATGMALLPFMAAGEGPTKAGKYLDQVKAGVDWLAGRVEKDGRITGSSGMYGHAIGTMALCDAARLSKDDKLKSKAELTVGCIVASQNADGAWGYSGAEPSGGDTSILGWQIQALVAADAAGIKFEKDKVYKAAEKFLESVSADGGANYGYREKGASQTLTPVGLLSRYYMRTLKPEDEALARGVKFLKAFPPKKDYFDTYYLYYSTRVLHHNAGPDWHKFWNPKMRDLLIELQDTSDEATRGSWEKDQGFIGSACGRLGTTALAVLTLEVYYRDLPLYKRDGGGLAELEK